MRLEITTIHCLSTLKIQYNITWDKYHRYGQCWPPCRKQSNTTDIRFPEKSKMEPMQKQ